MLSTTPPGRDDQDADRGSWREMHARIFEPDPVRYEERVLAQAAGEMHERLEKRPGGKPEDGADHRAALREALRRRGDEADYKSAAPKESAIWRRIYLGRRLSRSERHLESK